MSALKRLGEMLIEVADNGRVLQVKVGSDPETWEDNPTSLYHSSSVEYRLKPKVKYYRVCDFNGTLKIASSFSPFDDFDTWVRNSTTKHIHDFEKPA